MPAEWGTVKKYPILAEDHKADLDRYSVRHRYGDKPMSWGDAEAKAHEQYLSDQHYKAAAHHFAHHQAAEALNDKEASAKHMLHYTAHVKKAGGNPFGPVPKEVIEHMREVTGKHNPTSHGADALIAEEVKEHLSKRKK